MHVVRPFNPTDDEYQAITDVENSAWPENPSSAAEQKLNDENRVPEHVHARLVAEVDGQIVGVCDYGHTSWSYSPHNFFVGPTVHPDFRRQGIGTALYDRALGEVERHEPKKITCFTREDQPDAMRLLEKRGYEIKTREPVSHLEPAGFDPSPFVSSEERAEANGVRIVTLAELEESDPHCLRKLYDMVNEIDKDIPWHEELTPLPFDNWVKRHESNPNRIPEACFVALDGDHFVGISSLRGNQVSDAKLYTGLTGVLRSHRRLGLATAMKLRGIAYAQAQRTSEGTVPIIETDNEEGNPMLQINKRLGFVEQPAWLSYVNEIKA